MIKIIQRYLSKFSLVFSFVLVVSACGLGELASNPRVSDADNDQVVTIGDSIFALSGKLQDYLESYAGETFRRYTLSGAQLTGGILATSIAGQYEIAKNDNPNIETIVMDGGGNDILIPVITFDPYDCSTEWYEFGRLSKKCKNLIDDVYVEAVNLLNRMQVDGVDNVVYLGYYYTKNGIFRLNNMDEAIDYGDYRLKQACDFSAVDCVFVDPRSAIRDSNIIIDGIHPTSSGSRKLANLVWAELENLF